MIIKVREVVGTSPKSFDDALQNAIHHALLYQKKLSGVKIVGQSVDVKDGKISEYKVNAKLAYVWEE